MNPIIDTEDSIIAASVTALNGKVRDMEPLPLEISADVLRKMAAGAPATYVAYLGGKSGKSVSDVAIHIGVFAIYVVTDQASGGNHRQRGDARQIGAYDILNILIPLLHDHNVVDVGTLKFQRVQNLNSPQLDKAGVSMYGISFEIAMPLAYEADEGALDAFVNYHAEHSMAPGNDEPDAIDDVQLEQ